MANPTEQKKFLVKFLPDYLTQDGKQYLFDRYNLPRWFLSTKEYTCTELYQGLYLLEYYDKIMHRWYFYPLPSKLFHIKKELENRDRYYYLQKIKHGD